MRLLSPAFAACLLLGCQTSSPPPAPTVADTSSPKESPFPYKVLRDDLSNGSVEYHVLVDEKIKHDDAQKLLEFLYRHLMTRTEDPPAGVSGYLYTTTAAFLTPPRTPVGTVVKKPSDMGPTFENKVPLEFWQEIDQALGPRTDKGRKLALKIDRDDANKGVTLTVPYTEPGEDKWAETLSFNQAMQTFTDLAQALFGNVNELRSLTYSGMWKDKEVVKISINRADYTAIKLSEIDERIGQHHGRIFLSLSAGPHSNQSPEKANASAAKENAALIAREYRAMLAQLKGKATVASALK